MGNKDNNLIKVVLTTAFDVNKYSNMLLYMLYAIIFKYAIKYLNNSCVN